MTKHTANIAITVLSELWLREIKRGNVDLPNKKVWDFPLLHMKQKLTWYSLIESYPRTTSANFPGKKHENRLKMESNSMGEKFLRRNQISKTTQKTQHYNSERWFTYHFCWEMKGDNGCTLVGKFTKISPFFSSKNPISSFLAEPLTNPNAARTTKQQSTDIFAIFSDRIVWSNYTNDLFPRYGYMNG